MTVVALLLAAGFILFSLTTTLFSFEVNPLSQVPGDCFTGRVEALWNTARIFVAFTFFTQSYITPVGVLIIITIHTGALLAYHVHVLPYHLSWFNVVRGGVYATVLWAAVASLLVVALPAEGDFFQWSLLALIPIAFVAGGLCAHFRRAALMANLKRLRADAAAASAAGEPATAGLRMRRASLERLLGTAEIGAAAGPRPDRRQRDPFADFFDTDSRLSRAFDSAGSAHASIRSLLHEKDVRGGRPPPDPPPPMH